MASGYAPEQTAATKRFTGKVFLVTGASSGIGAEVAKGLAADGAHVVLAARRLEKLEEIKKSIEADGGCASVQQMDVLSFADVEKAINNIVTEMGRLDGAFNNAGGGGTPGTIADGAVEDFKKVFDLNFYGTYHCMKAELQVMSKQSSGSIVNNLSMLTKLHMGEQTHYGASKAALKYVQDSAAVEVAAIGVRVNSVSPGFTRPSEALDAFLDAMPGMEEVLKKASPAGKFTAAKDVYKSVAFLLDDETSGSISGTDIEISGGMSISQLKLG